MNEQVKTRFQIAYEVRSIAAVEASPLASAVQFISHLIGKKSEEKIGSSFKSEAQAEFQQIYLLIDFSKFPSGS